MASTFDPPTPLVRGLAEGRAVLFAGPGLSVIAGFPAWHELLTPLRDELGATGEKDLPDNSLWLAEYYELTFGRARLEHRVRQLLDRPNVEPSQLHRALVRLPFRAICTTAYDRLFEQALEAERVQHDWLCLDKAMSFGRSDRLALVKLNGDVHTPDSMILTRRQYDQYVADYPTLIRYLQDLVTNHVLLFVGFGLSDSGLLRIWNLVGRDVKRLNRRSFACVLRPRSLQIKSWRDRNLDLVPYRDHGGLPEFVEALTNSLREYRVSPTADETAANLDEIDARWRQLVLRSVERIDAHGMFQFERSHMTDNPELERVFVDPRLRVRREDEFLICPECGQTVEPAVDPPGLPEVVGTGDTRFERGRVTTFSYVKCGNPQCPAHGRTRRADDVSTLAASATMTAKEAFSRNRRIVLLGDPGAGKSTLLRAVALDAARRYVEPDRGPQQRLLPWIVELREYSAALGRNAASGLKTFLIETCTRAISELTAAAVLKILDDGQLLLLLDGLDEVDPARRQRITDEVAELASEYPGCQFVVTSRSSAYAAGRLIGTFSHFTVEPFGDAELADFLHRWYETFGSWDTSRLRPDTAAEKLLAELRAAPDIRAIATNPLMATILVLVHSVGRELPQRRSDFYLAAVSTLGRTWEAWKFADGVGLVHFPELADLISVLGEVAYRMNQSEETNSVRLTRLQSWLIHAFHDRVGQDSISSEQEVKRFLDMVRERIGLLVEKGFDDTGEPLIGFAHRTFQEYLAARHLARRAGRRAWLEMLSRSLHDSRWEEVIRLLVASLPEEDATEALSTILRANSEFEEVLARDLFLAGACLADDPPVRLTVAETVVRGLQTRAKDWAPDLRGLQAIDLLLDMTRLSRWQDTLRSWIADNPLGPESEPLVRAAALRRVARAPAELFHAAARLALNDENPAVQAAAVDYFVSQPAPARLSARNHVVPLLKAKEWQPRGTAVRFMVSLPDRATADHCMFSLLKEKEWPARVAAAEYFAALPDAERGSAADALVPLLRDTDPRVRVAALKYCAVTPDSRRLSTRRHAIASLNDGDSRVRCAAVRYIVSLPAAERFRANSQILALLRDPEWEVWSAAVEYFLSHSEPERSVVRQDFTCLLKDDDPVMRRHVVAFFASLPADERTTARDQIIRLLQDGDPTVQAAAIGYFASLAEGDRVAVHERILPLLKHKEAFVQAEAIEFLTSLPEAIRRTLRDDVLPLLKGNHWRPLAATVRYFASLADSDQAVREDVLRLLKDSDPVVREEAAEYFAHDTRLATWAAPHVVEWFKEAAPIRDTLYGLLRWLTPRRRPFAGGAMILSGPLQTWFDEPPPAVRSLLVRASTLADLSHRLPDVLPAQRLHLTLTAPLVALGERLLRARRGNRSLLDATAGSLIAGAGADPGAPSDSARHRLLWSWRLVAIYSRFFEPLQVLITSTTIPPEARREIARLYELPWDRHGLEAALRTLQHEAFERFGTEVGLVRGLCAPLVLLYSASTEPSTAEFYPEVVAKVLALSSIVNPSSVELEPSAIEVLRFVLTLCETLVEPWQWIAGTVHDPARLLDLHGVDIEMSEGGDRWSLGERMTFIIDLSDHEQALTSAAFNVDGWWTRASDRLKRLKLGGTVEWFPHIDIEIRRPDGTKDGITLGRVYVRHTDLEVLVADDAVTIDPVRGIAPRDLQEAVEGLGGEALAHALGTLLPFEKHRWKGPLAERAIELIRAQRLLKDARTLGVWRDTDTKETARTVAMAAAELAADLQPLVTHRSVGNYLAVLSAGCRSRHVGIEHKARLLGAAQAIALRRDLERGERTKAISLLEAIATAPGAPRTARDAAMHALGELYLDLNTRQRKTAAELAEQRLREKPLPSDLQRSLRHLLELHERVAKRR